ncbi:MAG: sortase [Candidatus Dojkabacteria bacterium]|nr:sortase [Candidatus Dojkabacteria bacterium]
MNKYTFDAFGNNNAKNLKKNNNLLLFYNKYLSYINTTPYKKKYTIGKFFGELYNFLIESLSHSKIASITIPTILIIFGLSIIYKQLFPEIQQEIIKNIGYLNQGNVSPVSETFIDVNFYIGKAENLEDLTKKAMSENVLLPDTVSFNYNNIFYISIPSLNINRLPVTPNVDSTSEQIYMPILERTLAHFKGTGLPISEIKNNIVIYGHSTTLSYGPSRNNPMLAFSFLPEIKIGDEVILHIDNRDYKFLVSKTRIVEPTDISIINGTRGKRTLTLFTCYPLGSNHNRFVVIAREI